MTIPFAARRSWLLLPAGLAWLLLAAAAAFLPEPAAALTVERSLGPRAENLRLVFSAGPAAGQAVRVGPREILVELPEGTWDKEPRPEPARFEGGLVRSVTPTDRGLVIELSTESFGSIALPATGGRLELTFFADPLGARWRPQEPVRPAAQNPAPAKPAAAKPKEAAPAPAQAQVKSPEKAAPAATPLPAKESTPEKTAKPGASPPASTSTPAKATEPAQHPAPAAQPAPVAQFSGSSALRAPIDAAGPDNAPSYSAPQPVAKVAEAPSPAPPVTPAAPARSEAQPATAHAPAPAPAQAAASQTAPPAAQGETPVPAPTPTPALAVGQEVRGRLTTKTLDELLTVARRAAETGSEQMDKERAAADLAVEEARAAKTNAPQTLPPADPAAPPKAEIAPDLEAQRRTKDNAGPPREGLEPAADAAEAELQRKMQEALQAGMMLFANRQYSQALAALQPLVDDPGTPAPIREGALYTIADAQFQLHRDALPAHHQTVVKAFDRAINFNPKSPRLPSALLSLGLVHLKVGNLPEASGYFNLLQQKYPGDPNLPYIPFYRGQYYYEHGEYQKAADEFQHLVQAFPDSEVVREASVGLARSLEALGYFDQAWQIVDYIRKRWPRYYLDAPSFLELAGNVALHLNKLDLAREDYWTYYNLEPKAPGMDLVLARLGDIYLRQDKPQTAREVYESVVERYPEEQGGLVAQMRLAEEGIHDDPSTGEMFSVFDRPLNLRPEEIYTRIIKRYPKSGLAPLAQLKLAMWKLWQKKFDEALAAVDEYLKSYPASPLVDSALKTGLAAFEQAARIMTEEENYGRVVDLWERYPYLAANLESLDPEARMALALSCWKRGDVVKALAMAKPFLTTVKNDKLSQMAVNLALSIYLDNSAWSDIVALAGNPGVAELPEKQRREVDYAHALALVSLGEKTKSKPIWTKLAAMTDLDPGQRAYALFYLARFAGEEDNLQNEYLYAQEALSLFLQAKTRDTEKIKDTLTMLMDVTQRAGRLEDAMRWADELGRFVPESDPNWPAYRFRLADIRKSMNDLKGWRTILEDLIAKAPDSLQARLAKTTLEAQVLEDRARQYSQGQ